MGWSPPWLCLLWFLFLSLALSYPYSNSSLCHLHESSALLQFKNSFSIDNSPGYAYCGFDQPEAEASNSKTLSWKNGTDCCTWSGVTCDKTGNVIQLDLHCSRLLGIIDSNSSLFLLTHIQSLKLSNNDFQGSQISSQFGRFTSLKHLNLSFSNFSGQVPLEISYLSNLLTLDLSINYEVRLDTSTMQKISTNLTSLRKLRICLVDMISVKPHSLMNLSSSLTYLKLRSSYLQGHFPENIFHRPNLQVLDLGWNEILNGSIPNSNWSSPLRKLKLSMTKFSVNFPYLTRTLKSLEELYLCNCKVIGSFPSMLVNITKISVLDLSYNNLNGQIPWFYLNLEKLTYLDLSGNDFSGQLPETVTNHSNQNSLLYDSSTHQLLGHVPLNLGILELSDNLLSGRIPSWLYSIPTLEYLNMQGNQFSGSIGEFQYGSLVHLKLGHNKLHGPFPASIFQQVNLRYLRLPGNKLSGVVDLHEFSKLKNLRRLDLSYNEISVSSNNTMDYTLSNILEILELSSCNMSEFPYSLRASETLAYLDLSYNRIQGNIPKWLWNVGKKNLYYLNLSHNFLTNVDQLPWKYLGLLDLGFNLIQGHLPIPPPSTSYFFISNNQLIGELPSLICSLTFVQVLDFSNNNLNGSIPMCLGNLSHLSVLDLKMNMFIGVIPTTFAKGNSLRNINLNGNRLEGPLPQALLNCRNLEILDLASNMINDTFPHWLESLPMLQVLILRSNNFHGSIDGPNVRLPFQQLRIMDLSYNQFNGRLPTKYFETFLAMVDGHVDKLRYMGENISYTDNGYYQDSVIVTIKGFDMELEKIQNIFITIDFSMNNFEGEIPELIGNLKGLKGLNLSHNNISGHIPPSLRNLTNLEWLDLSSNELSGSIPMQLIEMVWLEVLNLSQNQLVGAIPRGNQFDSFGKDAFIGNLGLCGFQLSIACDDRDQQSSPSEGDHLEAANDFDWKFAMLMGYGCGLVIGISVGSMLFSDKRLSCFIRNVGGEQWIELLRRQKKKKKKKKKKARFTNKRRNQ